MGWGHKSQVNGPHLISDVLRLVFVMLRLGVVDIKGSDRIEFQPTKPSSLEHDKTP
jgi:hypothetical protein